MPKGALSVFDPNINLSSPAGSCVLKMLLAAQERYRLCLFVVQTDMKTGPGVVVHRIPAPARPVLLQNMIFSLVALLVYLVTRADSGLTISTQGAFPFGAVCYSHNPHKLLLTRYGKHISGGYFTRTARILNFRWITAMESVAFRRARIIVVPSEGLAAELRETYSDKITAKLRIIANPVDCAAFSLPHAPCNGEFTFAFCALGNFEWKGLGLILDAMATGIRARLQVIGGNADEIRRFRLQAQSNGIAGLVTFAGMQTDIRPYLWTSHAFVFPSVHETFPLVCLQAAAASLPIIATDLYALDKLLQPGISGWRVDRTVESVSQAMAAAAGQREQAAAMGLNAKRLAEQYDEPIFQQRWLELLAEFA